MKHKLKGLIVVIIIATFALQGQFAYSEGGQFGIENCLPCRQAGKRYKDCLRPRAAAERENDLRTGTAVLKEIYDRHKYFLGYIYPGLEWSLANGEEGVSAVEKELSKLDKDKYSSSEINMIRFILVRGLLEDGQLAAADARELLEKGRPDGKEPLAYRITYNVFLGRTCFEEGLKLSEIIPSTAGAIQCYRDSVEYFTKAGILTTQEVNHLSNLDISDPAHNNERNATLNALEKMERERMEWRLMANFTIIRAIAKLSSEEITAYEVEIIQRGELIADNSQYLNSDMLKAFWDNVKKCAGKLKKAERGISSEFGRFLRSAKIKIKFPGAAPEHLAFLKGARKNIADVKEIIAKMGRIAKAADPESGYLKAKAQECLEALRAYWDKNNPDIHCLEGQASTKVILEYCIGNVDGLRAYLNNICIARNPAEDVNQTMNTMMQCVDRMEGAIARFKEVISDKMLPYYGHELARGRSDLPIVCYVLYGNHGSRKRYERVLRRAKIEAADIYASPIPDRELENLYYPVKDLRSEGVYIKQMREIEKADKPPLGIERNKITDYLEDDSIRCMLVKHKGHVAGFMFYEYTDADLKLLNVMVHPEYRNRGVGTFMVKRLQHRIDEGIFKSLIVPEINSSDEVAMMFLRRLRLKPKRTYRDKYGTSSHGYRMDYEAKTPGASLKYAEPKKLNELDSLKSKSKESNAKLLSQI
jgi:ribosomal protein S18 acetylase RimI-like enzyme